MTDAALVRAPGSELAGALRTHVEPLPIDATRAAAEHAGFVAVLRDLGVEVRELEPLPSHPDACFVEDTAIVLDEAAVLARPGAPSRAGEVDSVRAALAPHRELLELSAGTLDGGDVLVAGDLLLVGQSTRTDHAALKALAHAVLPHGLRVKAVEVRGVLHLKTACSYLGEGRLLVHRRPLGLTRVQGLELVDVPAEEPHGANVVRVAGRVLVPASAPRTADLLAGLGHECLAVEVGELAKAEAGLSCLALHLTGAAGAS